MILHLFRTPSDFENDARGFAINAAGHALIVGALPAYLWPVMIPVVLGLYALWEVAQWRMHNAEPWDCFHDFAFVCIGAMVALNPVSLAPLALASFYAAGVLRRV